MTNLSDSTVWQPKNKTSYNFFELSYAYLEALEPELFGALMTSNWKTFETAIEGFKALAGEQVYHVHQTVVCSCQHSILLYVY